MDRQRGNDDFRVDDPRPTGQVESTGASRGSWRPTDAQPVGDSGMVALSYIIAGVVLYGGLGWLASRWLHQSWPIAAGLIVGLAASTYLIAKRFGGLS